MLDFLKLAEVLKKSERMSDDEMVNGIIHLLTGRARIWFLANSAGINSWKGLTAAMKKEFLPKNYDYNLLDKIRNRKQRINEDFGEYFTHMKVLFSSLSSPQTEEYKLYIVQTNLSPKYANAIAPLLIRSLDDLDEVCKRIDDLSLGSGSLSANLPFEKKNHTQKFSWNRNQRDNNGWNNRSPMVYELETDQNHIEQNENEVLAEDTRDRGSKHNLSGCWNCMQHGHSFSQCPEPRTRVFCFRCGKADVTTVKCSNCSGNERRNSQSQGGKLNSGAATKNPRS